MYVIFLSPRHSLIDLIQHLFIKTAQVAANDPYPVIHGQADKVKSQPGDTGEITLLERFVAPVFRKFIEQVKPPPAGERLMGSLRKSDRRGTGDLNLLKKGRNKTDQDEQEEDTCTPKEYIPCTSIIRCVFHTSFSFLPMDLFESKPLSPNSICTG